MKTAFVTGASGFLGQNLLDQLIKADWKVTAFDLDISILKRYEKDGVSAVTGDITDPEMCVNAIPENVDAVFHIAGDTSHWKLRDEMQTRINVDGTRIMANAALKKNARRFILTSSIGSFGAHPGRIFEDFESNALDSKINYWRTKYLAELEVEKCIEKGLDAVIINPSNIIGAYDFSGWAQMFMLIEQNKLPGAPPGMGSFCHARETALAHISAVENGRCGHKYLLAVTDETWLGFVQEMGKCLNRKVPQKAMPEFLLKIVGQASYLVSCVTGKEPDLTPEKAELVSTRLICGTKKAVEELGYKPIPLAEMLQDSFLWLKQEGYLKN